MIGEDSEWVNCAFKVMTPFLKGTDYCEKFTIIDVVVAFGVIEGARHKGNGVPIAICILLMKDGASREFGSICFELKWAVMIGDDEDGGGGERVFKLVKSILVSGGPEPRDIFTSEGIQRGNDVRGVGNKLSIEVPKAEEGFDVLDILRNGPQKNAIEFGGVHGN